MANQYLKRTTLYVEGRDDLHSIAVLLEMYGFRMEKTDSEPRDVEIHPVARSEQGFGREHLLSLVQPAVKASTDTAVGFVIDADESASATWEAVRNHIETAVGRGCKLPKTCPPDGLVQNIPSIRSRVGVWVMPNNSSPGILEDFLQQLIREKDKLLPIAKSATDEAKEAGAAFKGTAQSKAIVHAWLAWQADPGCPFGIAIKAHYFDHDAASGKQFAKWLKRLVD